MTTTLKSGAEAHAFVPVSGIASWTTVIPAGGVDGQDNSGTVTNPASHISNYSSRIFKKESAFGTLVKLRIRYEAANKPSTDPIVALFGRTRFPTGDASTWELLRNKSAGVSATLVTATTDAGDGDNEASVPGDGQTFDTNGCNEFVVGVLTAAAGTNIATATVEAKII